MAGNYQARGNVVNNAHMDDGLEESLLASPPKKLPVRNAPSHSRHASSQNKSRENDPAKEQHEAALRQELASVRKVNEAIEGVLESLEKAKSNMKSVNRTVNNASSLLNIWTRILSQTEHNQRLILDPSWQGASRDITDMEEEAQAKEEAAARKEAEEQERRAAIARKAEDDERRRTEVTSAVPKPKPGIRGRGLTRASSTGRAGYVAIGTSVGSGTASSTRGSLSSRRTTSGFSRGSTSRNTRGREQA